MCLHPAYKSNSVHDIQHNFLGCAPPPSNTKAKFSCCCRANNCLNLSCAVIWLEQERTLHSSKRVPALSDTGATNTAPPCSSSSQPIKELTTWPASLAHWLCYRFRMPTQSIFTETLGVHCPWLTYILYLVRITLFAWAPLFHFVVAWIFSPAPSSSDAIAIFFSCCANHWQS